MDREFTIMLLRLLLSIAWADGDLDGEEAEMLRDFVDDAASLTDLDKQEYSKYFEQPYTVEGRGDALEALKQTITSQDQIHHVIYNLRKMICADGEVDDNEQQVYDSIRKELQAIVLKLRKAQN